MDTITFDKLLLKTAFCCMASDGVIDKREIELIKSMCENSPLFKDFNFQGEVNSLIKKLNEGGKEFISNYFDILKHSSLSEREELDLIDFAIRTINADELVEYSEIKFFKVIRSKLKVSNDRILESYPSIEIFLEEDIVTETYLDKLVNSYFESTELPQFELIGNIDTEGVKDDKGN